MRTFSMSRQSYSTRFAVETTIRRRPVRKKSCSNVRIRRLRITIYEVLLTNMNYVASFEC